MILVETHYVKPSDRIFIECDQLAFASKNHYNSCMYLIKQTHKHNEQLISALSEEERKKSNPYKSTDFINSDGEHKSIWITSNTYLYYKMKDHETFRTLNHDCYNNIGSDGKLIHNTRLAINTKVLKQTQIQVAGDYSNYFKAHRDWFKHKDKYNGEPQPPKYKKKTGRNTVTFPKDAVSFKKKAGYIHLGMTNIYIRPRRATEDTLLEVKIVPKIFGYDIKISYEVADIAQHTEHTKYAGIDLGVNVLAAISSNDPKVQSVIVNGKPIKYTNCIFNKSVAKLKSKLPKGIYTSDRIKAITLKREHRIHDYMHKASSYIIEHLIKSNITCLVIGNNRNWKKNAKLGKVNNQKFVYIPFGKFKSMLKYKCELVGIEYIETEESYTSKCSFIDMETMCKHVDSEGKDAYKGRRNRRKFISRYGIRIHADMNGSYNIIRKVRGNDVFKRDTLDSFSKDYAVSPIRITLR